MIKQLTAILILTITGLSSCVEESSCEGCGNRPWAPEGGGRCYETEDECKRSHGSCQYCR